MNNRHLIVATAGLFTLADALFALSLRTGPALAALAGCVGAITLVSAARGEAPDGFLARRLDIPMFCACLVVAVAVLVVGGEGHFLHTTNDWLVRDAVLADLSRQAGPVVYEFKGDDYLLRAPLGMYMAPAFLGRALGLQAAHLTMLAQNSLLLASLLYGFAELAGRRKAAVVTLFLVFAGLDIIPLAVVSWARHNATGQPFIMPSVTTAWNTWFSFPTHFTQLFWAPNHTLPGWWIALLAVLVARGEMNLGAMIAAIAPLALWSTLSILFAPVLLAFLALRRPREAVLDPRNWLAVIAALFFAPVALYLSLDAGAVPSSWLIFEAGFWALYVITMLTEIPHALVVVANRDLVEPADRGLLWLCLAILLIIPVYSFGPTNDFALRASIPPLAMLAFEFALVATRIDSVTRPRARLAVILIIGVGLFAPGFEIARAFLRAPFAISDCTFMQAREDRDPGDMLYGYIARAARAPAWLLDASGASPIPFTPRDCWPDHPLPGAIHIRPAG